MAKIVKNLDAIFENTHDQLVLLLRVSDSVPTLVQGVVGIDEAKFLEEP